MATSIETIISARLTLNRVQAEDLADYCRLFQNADVMENLGGPDTDKQQTAARLNRHIDYWVNHGVGPWVARLKKTEQFVGMGGLQRIECQGHKEMSVGYALLPEFWGQGYAAKIASMACCSGFEHFPIPSIVSITLPENFGSQRVMEKVGFSFEREIQHFGLTQLLYRIERPN